MSTNEADARSPFDKLHSIMQSYGVGDGWADEDPASYAQFLAEIDTMYADEVKKAVAVQAAERAPAKPGPCVCTNLDCRCP